MSPSLYLYIFVRVTVTTTPLHHNATVVQNTSHFTPFFLVTQTTHWHSLLYSMLDFPNTSSRSSLVGLCSKFHAKRSRFCCCVLCYLSSISEHNSVLCLFQLVILNSANLSAAVEMELAVPGTSSHQLGCPSFCGHSEDVIQCRHYS